MTINARSESFFFYITLLMIALIFAGFGSAAMFLDQFIYPPSTMLIAHGVIMLGWYGLTAYQARLIRGSRFKFHKQLGASSVALTLLMLITGYFVTKGMIVNPASSIAGLSPAGSTIFPTMDLIGFALFYILALANRKNASAHKRLVVLAGVMMLAPASARLGLTIGFEPLAGVVAIAFPIIFLIYDWRSLGRLHWASILAVVVGFGGTAIRMVVGPTQEWQRVAETLYLTT
ncbi:MAG: hypothetical protein ABJN35_14990 [Erythrobacter sp.]